MMKRPSKTVIVTGGNSGLGFETARAILHEADGWHVVIAGRSLDRCQEAVRTIESRDQRSSAVEAMVLELASLAAVRQFALHFSAGNRPPCEPSCATPGSSTSGRRNEPRTVSRPPSGSTTSAISFWQT